MSRFSLGGNQFITVFENTFRSIEERKLYLLPECSPSKIYDNVFKNANTNLMKIIISNSFNVE